MKPASLPHKRFSVVASNTENNYIASHTDAAPVSGGSASLSASTFNLAKSIIGAGVLSLPSGVAFFADEPSALMPASVICAVFGLVAAYSFSSIGKVCRDTKSKSFQEVWEKTVSPKTAWTISGSITAMCFLASLAYSIFIGDSFTSLAQVSPPACRFSNIPYSLILL
jgi:amino acid permease